MAETDPKTQSDGPAGEKPGVPFEAWGILALCILCLILVWLHSRESLAAKTRALLETLPPPGGSR